MWKRFSNPLLIAVLLTVHSVRSVLAEPPTLDTEASKLGIAFHRYTTKDNLGRTISFYLSAIPVKEPTSKLPIVLFIQGSGCQSLWQKHGDRVGGGMQNLLLVEAKGKARILVVEKPGVKFLDQPQNPGSAIGASEEFLQEHTLPRWAEANCAALRAAWALPNIDTTRTLVSGHSEGGIVAARVAAELPQVTHVASLAAGGPTQLFDFITNAAKARPDDKPGDAAQRLQRFYDDWARIQKDPDSTSRMWMGHPNRRWSSFLRDSVIEELQRSKARIYLGQGVLDPIIPVASHDMAVAELRSKGRDVVSDRVEGADHGFQTADMPKQGPPKGMQDLFGRLLKWFLVEEGTSPGSNTGGPAPSLAKD